MNDSYSPPEPHFPMRGTRRRRIVRNILGLLVILPATVGGLGLWQRAVAQRAMKRCQENLTRIDGAKEQFALEHDLRPGSPVTWTDLYKADGTGYLRVMPKEPLGGTYTINVIGVSPHCSKDLPAHSLTRIMQVFYCPE